MLALVNAPFDGNIRYILHRITGTSSNAAFSTEAASANGAETKKPRWGNRGS